MGENFKCLIRNKWEILCFFCIFPFTAILHHIIFYRNQCILNPFGWEYNFSVIAHWLIRDPSLPWAIIISALVYFLGRNYSLIKKATFSFFIAFIPITVWLWDIPGTHRIICRTFHDGQYFLLGVALNARHLYILGIILWAIIFLFLLKKEKQEK